MDDMDDLGSHELRPVDVMNCSRLWMIWMILCHELKPLDAMNYQAMDDMNDSGS